MKKIIYLPVILIFICGFFAILTVTAAKVGDYNYTLLRDGSAEIVYYTGTQADLTIPDELDGHVVTSIAYAAFSECTPLETVIIPNTVTKIGESAFEFCGRLTSVTIPESVVEISDYTFYGSDNLTIYGKSGSYAERFARNNSIPFSVIPEDITTSETTSRTTSETISQTTSETTSETTLETTSVTTSQTISETTTETTSQTTSETTSQTTSETTTETTSETTTETTTSETTTQTTSETAAEITEYGDVNSDGKCGTLSDVILFGRYLGSKADLTEQQKLNADCNSEVGLTAQDLIVLIKLSFNEISVNDLPL